MAKAKKYYVCTECGYETSGWLGKCPQCGAWNTLVERESASTVSKKANAGIFGNWVNADADAETETSCITKLSDVEKSSCERFPTGIAELDQVLSGGIVQGEVILLGGDPGIGKSTLALQILGNHSGQGCCLYVSGEESAAQIFMRAERLGVAHKDIELFTDTDFNKVAAQILQRRPAVVVMDSIQTMYNPELMNAPGSVTQIRSVALGVLRLAKKLNTAFLITGHVTKGGDIAGPRILEHMVDAVLYFEGEKDMSLRMLRAVKNRFGTTDEIGFFTMTEKGLVSVDNGAAELLKNRPLQTPGSAVSVTMEGTRPVIIEIQALTVPSPYGNPLRMTSGVDKAKVSLLLAVLTKHGKIDFAATDAYVNVTGGLKIVETAADLAVVAALVSSMYDKPLKQDFIFLGEVGLTGEIRDFMQLGKRIDAAVKAGFKKFMLPEACESKIKKFAAEHAEFDFYYVGNIGEAIDLFFA